jgi:predicted Fe-S protein YdhL (DUF1289 family)
MDEGALAVNLGAARSRHTGPGVPSPCHSVCRMNAANALCEGCWRSIEEIAGWSRMADADKLAVWQRIEARQRVVSPLNPSSAQA